MNYWAKQEIETKDGFNSFNPEAIVTKNNLDVCGTQCCIAGWQLVRKGFGVGANAQVFKGKKMLKRYAPALAGEQLGLNQVERSRLFYPGNEFEEGGKFKNTPKGAAKRIRHFIKTGE